MPKANIPIEINPTTVAPVITFVIQAILLVSIGSYWAGDAFGRLEILEDAQPASKESHKSVLQMEVRQEHIVTDLKKIERQLIIISQQIQNNTVMLERHSKPNK